MPHRPFGGGFADRLEQTVEEVGDALIAQAENVEPYTERLQGVGLVIVRNALGIDAEDVVSHAVVHRTAFESLTLDWFENWQRLAFYPTCRGEGGTKLDGTNNMTEQVIGQCVKERYRTMRGYKCTESILNVSSLIGWARAKGADYEMSELAKS